MMMIFFTATTPYTKIYSGTNIAFFVRVHQELVNLLLCGRAASNVFDNDMELDSGNGNVTLLKGIKSQCEVGLLSLFEHYDICQVSDIAG